MAISVRVWEYLNELEFSYFWWDPSYFISTNFSRNVSEISKYLVTSNFIPVFLIIKKDKHRVLVK